MMSNKKLLRKLAKKGSNTAAKMKRKKARKEFDYVNGKGSYDRI